MGITTRRVDAWVPPSVRPPTKTDYTTLPALRPQNLYYKRLSDIVFSLILLPVLAVPLLIIAGLIKAGSPGPVLFRQSRRGRHGRPFACLKFRTMYVQHTDGAARRQSCRDDPRVTPLGRLLRRTSLDELPQLFNVLRGEMSLVGPRPHAFGTNIDGRLLPEIAEDYLARYVMRPGITGWAQVHGWRGNLDTELKLRRRLDHDLYYVAHWSPLLDLRILFRTLKCVRDRNAF